MDAKLTGLSRRYEATLQKHLEQRPRTRPQSADRVGRRALAIGLETLDLTKIHEQALTTLMSSDHSSGTRDGKIKRAQVFFVKAVTPIEKTHRATMEAIANTKGLKRNIARPQRPVTKSLDVVHQFAGQLRPRPLDDLGLIPALHSRVNDFAKRTGHPIHFTSFTRGKTGKLDSVKRTVLYRVVQESLVNVAKHAQASLVNVSIQKRRGVIRMEVKDNGKSFQVQGALRTGEREGLGLLGMRERVEMVGGRFTVESAPGKGTMIRVNVPCGNGIEV